MRVYISRRDLNPQSVPSVHAKDRFVPFSWRIKAMPCSNCSSNCTTNVAEDGLKIAEISLQSDLHLKFQQYNFSPLCLRLQRKLVLQEHAVAQLFADLKTWMYMSAVSDAPLSPPAIIDEAWHNFILFTQEYQKFCAKYCGRFIHHLPFDGMEDVGGVKNAAHENSVRLFTKLGLSGKNWQLGSSEPCCNGGNCSNEGTCSHCTTT